MAFGSGTGSGSSLTPHSSPPSSGADPESPNTSRRTRYTKDNHFIFCHSRKHHPFNQKAPYPANYEKDVLDL